MISKGGLSAPEEDYIDEYVVGIQSPTQLTCSLAFLLREPNYVVLYDTSIFSSPEPHLKRSNLSELNKDFLYKWYLFFTGLHRNLENYDNLIIIPDVAEEIDKLIQATLFALDKRKNQYRTFSSENKNEYQNVFEQLVKNEDILRNILNVINDHKKRPSLNQPVIFEKFLALIKFLDDQLGLKKPNSREINDTDERVAARTFYELIVNNHNVAVYTRDDDVRKLISATFKFFVSRQLNGDQFGFLKKLSFNNILVLKYNYEKKVFSRFFESSTLSPLGDFRFPRKLGRGKINNIINYVQELMRYIDNELTKVEEVIQDTKKEIPPCVEEKENKYKVSWDALEGIFKLFQNIKFDKEDITVIQNKLSIIDYLITLAKNLGHQELLVKLEEWSQEHRRHRLEIFLQELREESKSLQEHFNNLSTEGKDEVGHWQKIQAIAQQIQENIQKTKFFENALSSSYYEFTLEDYKRFRELIMKFEQGGYRINEKDTGVPTDQIALFTAKSVSMIIKIIEDRAIQHQGTQAYINQSNIIYFL